MNHAAVAPLSTRVRDEMKRQLDDVTENGTVSYAEWCRAYERTRASAAQLVGSSPHEIAFMRNTSEAISTVANGIDWREATTSSPAMSSSRQMFTRG
jgi:selenocysteine lyase/cysteine desulfurase